MKIICIITLTLLTLSNSCSSIRAESIKSQCETASFQPLHLRHSDEQTGLYKFKIDGKWGLIDKLGKSVVAPQFETIDSFFEGRAIFQNSNGKFGYLDSTGNISIDAQFENAMRFHENRAAVKLNGKWGYIDSTGRWAIEPKFEEADSFYEGRAFVRTTGVQSNPVGFRYGVIDLSGKWIFSEKIDAPSQFVQDVAIVYYPESGKNKVGILDRTGSLRALTNVGLGEYPHRFSNGLWAARNTTPAHLAGQSEIGFVNEKGQFVISTQFQATDSFNYCAASVKVSDKWGLIDTKGAFLLLPQFQFQPTYLGSGIVRVQTESKMIKSDSSIMVDGVQRQAKISKYSSRFGLMNLQGEWISSPDKGFIGDPSEGLIAFELDGKVGFMNTTGRVVVEPKFDTALPFANQRSYVTIGSEQGYIDQTGKVLWWSKK